MKKNSNHYSILYYKRWAINSTIMLAGDVTALLIAVMIAGWIRLVLRDVHIPPSRSFMLIPLWCISAIVFRIVPSWGLGSVEELRRQQILLLGIFGIAATTMFFTQSADITSRIKFGLIYVLSALLIPSIRLIMKKTLLKLGLWGMPTVIYGNDETVSHVLDVIGSELGLGFIPVGVFDNQTPIGQEVHGVQVLGEITDFTRNADVAILGVPSIPREQLQTFLDGPLSNYRRVIIIPDLLDIPSLWVSSRDFMGVLGLELERNLLNPIAKIMKGSAERLFVLITLPLWLPLCLLLLLLVWLQDGKNPLFMQHRIGRHGKTFRTFKFRTMVPNAEAVLENKLQENKELFDEWNEHHKLKNDPRITFIGNILRRSSLDELPQLINVLTGTMSLVGPRPLPAYHHNKLPEQTRQLREMVLPGITGMWQVSGRSESGTDGMVRWDTYYVRNWSPWLDIVILIRTFRSVLSGSGAY